MDVIPISVKMPDKWVRAWAVWFPHSHHFPRDLPNTGKGRTSREGSGTGKGFSGKAGCHSTNLTDRPNCPPPDRILLSQKVQNIEGIYMTPKIS